MSFFGRQIYKPHTFYFATVFKIFFSKNRVFFHEKQLTLISSTFVARGNNWVDQKEPLFVVVISIAKYFVTASIA